jgi:hypothetical protein
MTDKKGETIQLTAYDLKEMIATAIRESKRNEEAEIAKQQKEEQKAALLLSETEGRKQRDYLQNNLCDHHRRFDGTWNIGWSPYADGKPRGVCGSCGLEIGPEHPKYKDFLTNGSTRGYNLTYGN